MLDAADRDLPPLWGNALVLVPKRAARDLVIKTLESERFDVVVAEEPYEAMAHFVRHPAKLLVVSMEFLKPRERSFLEELRRFAPDLRVILLVPSERRRDLSLFMQAGADVLLSTPFYEEELRLLVRSTIRSDGTDPLTLLPNRGAADRACPQEVARAKRDETSLGLGLLDIDHFGNWNKKLGYRGADDVLREIARRIRSAFRVTDPVCRWGGEEFVVLLTGLPQDLGEARELACEALRRSWEAVRSSPIVVPTRDDIEVTVRISGGLGLYPHEAAACPELFDVANRRLQDAKDGGRDRVECGEEADEK